MSANTETLRKRPILKGKLASFTNPARSLGPALFAGGKAIIDVWIYFWGPFLGAFLAVALYQMIRGSGDHTKDVLEEPPDEEKAVLQKKPDSIDTHLLQESK